LFLTPLLHVGVYWLIFGVLLDTSRGVPNVLSFLAVGVFVYRFAQSVISAGTKSITGNLGLIRTIYFPRAILPTQDLMYNLYELIPTTIVMLVFIVVVGDGVEVTWLLYPVVLVGAALFALGGALFSARINTIFQDWNNVLPFIFRIGMYASGVIFPLEERIDSEAVRTVMVINPFYAYLSLARSVLLGGEYYSLPAGAVLSASLWATVFPMLGLSYFRRGEFTYGD
jgi:teichoic acid transport system permease protein